MYAEVAPGALRVSLGDTSRPTARRKTGHSALAGPPHPGHHDSWEIGRSTVLARRLTHVQAPRPLQPGLMTTTPAAKWLDSYPAECECAAVMLDGRATRIRPIRPSDAAALSSFHEHLSSETIYRRFFGAHPHLRDEEVARFTEVDYRYRLALVAEVEGDLVGVARYDRLPGTDRAEVAFVVVDALQGHGLGTLLLEHLAVAARRRGVGTFEAQTLGTNYGMQAVFAQTGFACVQRWGDGVVEVCSP